MLTSFKNYGIFLVIAIVIASVLLSNQAGINMFHHHSVPSFVNGGRIDSSGFIWKEHHIRLTTEITKREDYQEVYHIIGDATARDTVYIHLAGNGGEVDTVQQLYNIIKNSPAKIIMVVEGDVYSGHAFLAFMGDEVIIGRHVNFLVHTSSLYGAYQEACKKNSFGPNGEVLTDRGQPLYDKCINFYSTNLANTERMIQEVFSPVLTKEELDAVLTGSDVIINGEVIRARLQNKGN